MRTCAICLVVGSILSFSSGCATIVKGRYQDLTINSNPSGASFEVDGISGTTPATVPVERKRPYHTVILRKPGYETAQIQVGRRICWWTAGNVVFGLVGAPVGIVVDTMNGSAYKLVPDMVQVDLQPELPLADRKPSGPNSSGTSTVLEAQHVEALPSERAKISDR